MSEHERGIDFAHIRQTVDIVSVVSKSVALKQKGREWIGICPFHSEKTPSFTVYPTDRGARFHCFGCGSAGDVIDFVAKSSRCDIAEAARILGDGSEVVAAHPPSPPVARYVSSKPPSDAPRPPVMTGAPAYWYRDSDGTILGASFRINEPNGKKSFAVLSWGSMDGAPPKWEWKHWTGAKPLYGLDRLAERPDAPVIVCEGEKAADAAQSLFPGYVAVTWPGGSEAVAKADWTPLAHRYGLIWPDADAPGRKAALAVSARWLGGQIIRVDDLPDGFDAADLATNDPGEWLGARLPEEPPNDHDAPPITIDERPIPPWEVYVDGAEIKPTPPSDPGEQPKERIWVEATPWVEAAIPKRPWIAPGFLMRRALTVLSGPGSAGKSSIVVAWTTALALGMDYGRFGSASPMRCLTYNVEDDRDEQLRRYSATSRQFGRTPVDIMPNLRIVGPTELGTLLRLGPNGVLMVNTPVMDALETLISEWRPDAVFLDPFVELHSSEENDNTAVRQVLARFRSWAVEMNMAVCILHHARKGGTTPGDPDSLRGASAIVGAARVALTINVMTEQEADDLGVSKNVRRDYFRMDGAKINYARVQDADWFERVEYELDNGEGIAAAVPWIIKTQTVDLGHVQKAISAIERGSPIGPWSAKLSRDARSIKHAFIRLGVTAYDAQRELLSRVLEEDGVENVMFRDAARTRKMGLRTVNGPEANWEAKEP